MSTSNGMNGYKNGNTNGHAHGNATAVKNGYGNGTDKKGGYPRYTLLDPTPELFEAKQDEQYDPEFEALISAMLERVGEDPQREGLLRTPLRVAKAMDFLTSGYTTDLETVVNNAIFEDDGEEMVIVKEIEFYSMCEHHMLPFFGKAHIAYIPNGKIIGLSKLARITDVFARRLQVQERMTNQVADALMEILDAQGVAVITEAQHLCMMMRGVQKQGSSTIASAMRGTFKTNPLIREEFTRSVR